MKSIVFLLPCSAALPVGGFKVVYEYANRLVQDGFDVSIVYAATLFPQEYSLIYRCRRMHYYWNQKQTKEYLPDKWFNVNEQVKQKWVFSLVQKNIPVGDYYIATSWETAEYLAAFKNISKDCKFYFVQSYENWSCSSEQRLLATWKADLHKIVIASWLKNIANELGEDADIVENGFDFADFRIILDIVERDPHRLVMLYHPSENKGVDDAFNALEIVKKQFPNLTVNLFGAYPKPKNLPEWYVYYQLPDRETLNRLYNEAAIYIGSSHMEGWALTLGEAMQCGCAVACTDIDGYLVMARHEETALVSPVKDFLALSANVIRLINDTKLRYQIAMEGNRNIQKYTWERAYLLFKSVITRN